MNLPWWVEKLFISSNEHGYRQDITLWRNFEISQKRPKWVIYLNKLEQVQAIKTEQNVSIIKIDYIKKGNTPV